MENDTSLYTHTPSLPPGMEISIHFTLFYTDSLPVSVEEVPGLQHSVLPGREEQGHPDGAPATSSQSDT